MMSFVDLMGFFLMTKNIYVYKRNFEFSNNHESENFLKWYMEECSKYNT